MTVAKECPVPEPLISPAVKAALENSRFGRIGLGVGRPVVRFFRKLRDPVRHKVWIRQFGLPLRNAMLLNRPVTASFDGITVRLHPRGATASEFWAGIRCETHEVSFILRVLESGMNFFDVGANAGLFAISAAKKIGGMGVIAFEPCSLTCDLLRQNLLLNGLAGVKVVQKALGDSVGAGVLQINARGKDGLNTLGRATHPDAHVVGQEDVSITTVDVFMRQHNITRVDVMKVDIEGAELMLFRGARNLLERTDAPLILYEGFGFLSRGFGYHPVEILWFLESCGYTLFLLNSETGAISELRDDYQYNSMVIAVKPGHPAYSRMRGGMR
jgi:FkbM family methyltransferase